MKNMLAGLLVFLLACPQLRAGTDPSQKHIDKIRKKVATCVDKQKRVSIETYDDRRLQGVVSEAGTDDFVLVYGGSSITLTYANVKKIKWPSELSRQTKALVGAAVVTGIIFGLVILLGGLRD